MNGVSAMGNPDEPHWLELNVAGGQVNINGRSVLAALVLAPASKVGIYSNARLKGGLRCDRLDLNSHHAVLELTIGEGAPPAGAGPH